MSDREAQSVFNQHIGLQKAILWEEAKGKLQALAVAGGQTDAVEEFITAFESEGMHE